MSFMSIKCNPGDALGPCDPQTMELHHCSSASMCSPQRCFQTLNIAFSFGKTATLTSLTLYGKLQCLDRYLYNIRSRNNIATEDGNDNLGIAVKNLREQDVAYYYVEMAA